MIPPWLTISVRNFSTPRVVQVLSLDARDTLIKTKESPARVYSRFAKEKGLIVQPDLVFNNFLKNYRRLSVLSPCFGFKDGGAKKWWNEVVTSTLLDCSPSAPRSDVQIVADSLYDFYATAEPWELVEKDVKHVLQKLHLKGIILVVASNFDTRLKALLSQFGLHDLFSMIILSGEIGYEKPDGKIFQLIVDHYNLSHPSEILHIGLYCLILCPLPQMLISFIAFPSMDLFRKPKKRNVPTKASRQKSSSSEDETTVKDVVRKRRRTNPMVQSTRKAVSKSKNSSDDTEESDDPDVAVATHSFASTGDSGPSGPRDQGATATLEVDTDYSRDAQAQFERVQEQLKEGVEKDGKVLYKGSALYGAKEAKDTAKGNASSGYNRVGPVRAPQFLRQTVRWDFAPDICKDYKETGFCTFGDSCKFVHDRSDYKHGWEIDEEYEAGKYGVEDDTNYEINDEDEKFPELCFVCGNTFVDPIVTKCKHYLCSGCALTSFKKSSKCPICGQNTDRIMNAAKDLINYLKKRAVSNQKPDTTVEDDDGDKEEQDHTHCEHPVQQGVEDEMHGGESVEAEQEIQMEDVEGLEGGENGEDSDGTVGSDD